MESKHYPLYIAVPFLLVSVIFILGVTFGIPLGDEWVWLKRQLIPFSQGEISFSRYMLGEYAFLSHSHYLALLFLLADYHWFGLNFSYFTYLGIIFYALGYLALLFYLKRFLQGNLWWDSAALIIVSVGYFCITSDFPWLLVVFEYTYFFLAIVLLIALDRFVQQEIKFTTLLVFAFLSLLLGDTIGMAATFICGAALLIRCFISIKNAKHFAIFSILLLSFFVAQYLILGGGVVGGGHGRAETLHAITKAPFDVLVAFMSIFSQPLVDITIFRYLVGEKNAPLLQFGLGIFGFIFISTIVFAYFYYRGWKKSWLPMLLIGYSFVSWALILVSRYMDLGMHVMDEPRYVRLFTLLYVGGGMALLCINLQPLAKRFYMASAAIILAVYGGTLCYKFWQDQYIESYFANARIELQKDVVDSAALATYIGRCADNYCATSVDFMKKNQLSIFNSVQK